MTSHEGTGLHLVRANRLGPWLRPADLAKHWRPPLRRPAFWAVQALVLAIAAGHMILELTAHRFEGASLLIPTSFFLVPVVYAALNFGVSGSVPTALWCAALSVPNIVALHDGPDRVGEIWQIATVVGLALFVGDRVDHEKHARMEAEHRERDRQASEEKYRGVFDQVAEPILLLDGSGIVSDANRAALGLFATDAAPLIGKSATELLGPDPAVKSASLGPPHVRAIHVPGRADPAWIEPVVIPFVDPGGARRIQLLLRDVTERYVRQQELEAYTRQTIAAREAERGRIARELHDGPVQSLVALWRKLDTLGSLPGPRDVLLLTQAQRDAQAIADELRRFSRDLRPSILDDLGLTAALKAETSGFARRSGLSARFATSGRERRLGDDYELMFLRVTQEALRNAEQHSSARSVVVRLRYQPDRSLLRISDDGKGLPERQTTAGLVAEGKLGLIGMQERARSAGATFRINSRPGAGTTVEVDAPI
ncbi:MAG: ATP-binding protein [Candidatus Limnocylindrales bacterium]